MGKAKDAVDNKIRIRYFRGRRRARKKILRGRRWERRKMLWS